MRTLLVTGGAGFIGASFIRHLLATTEDRIVNFDKLTYAANPDALSEFARAERCILARADLVDADEVAAAFERHRPDAVVHLAAESHVDRSIDGPGAFIATNIDGTFNLLRAAHHYWSRLSAREAERFRLVHVSTDEVFGSALPEERFTEATRYDPNSPYAASKAAADHLVRAWHTTYGMPTVVTNCSNNYGPWQFPEKLIPLVIQKALGGEPIPVYGDGSNVRDWIYVDDHVRALSAALDRGVAGETYLIGSDAARRNIDVVLALCAALDRTVPASRPYRDLIQFVADRPGHDRRYAIDASKARRELGWRPSVAFDDGIRRTVAWYLANRAWLDRIRSRSYGGERLGSSTRAREALAVVGRH